MKYVSDDIRKALAAWYEGSADVKQEQMLLDYFAGVNPDEIPADMRADAVLFRGEALIRKESMPELCIEQTRKRRFVMMYPILAVAASLLVIVLLSVRKPFYGYDYDGSRITSQAEAMESAEYLQCLNLLDDDIFMISEMIK